MNLQGKKITVHDMTLRDGMHPKRHLMTLEQMKSIACGLDEAGIPLIEVTHGDGLGGSSVNYGFPAHTDEEYLGAVIPLMKKAKVSALLLPGIGTVDHLRMAHDLGVHTIRVATHCTEADVSEQHITLARKLDMDTVGFLMMAKAGTAMHDAPPCPPDDYLDAIALARLILPPEVHLQAPPNLSDDFGVLLDAGIDDWGGVSPITDDHVNPERPWPDLDRLTMVTETRGFTLAPRLTAYPEHVRNPSRWFEPGLQFAIMDRSDSEGLGRDDPGAVFPEVIETISAEDGAEVRQVGSESFGMGSQVCSAGESGW